MVNKKVKGSFLTDEPMAKHTSYGIGGPAQAYITPSDQKDLKQINHFMMIVVKWNLKLLAVDMDLN